MTERVQDYLKFHLDRGYRKNRKTVDYGEKNSQIDDNYLRITTYLSYYLDAETPLIFENDIFGFNKTVANECGAKFAGSMNNFTPDYAWALDNGFDAIKLELKEKAEQNPERAHFYGSAIKTIDLMYAFCDRYREEAERKGVTQLAEALRVVPMKSPENYYQALLFMKILIFILRSSHVDHLTMGRFDQYMYKYFQISQKQGMTNDELLELTELFFISLNMDTDLYYGIQQGDNGQSLVLGGKTLEVEDAFNDLSEIVLTASEELCIIDPKINLRVNSKTPLDRYVRATHLTKKGLGFPQYCNDDIVIPGLMKLGYKYEDAVDYTLAACWEFITPGTSYDISNINTMNFPLVVRRATVNGLKDCESFDQFMECVYTEIEKFFEELKAEADYKNKIFHTNKANPFASMFVRGCRNSGKDFSEHGADYNNYGVHGLGIGPAVDAITAIRKLVFDDKSVTADELITAMENNFEGYEQLRAKLIACPKMGNNDEYVDSSAWKMLEFYQKTVNNVPNGIGGVFRAGTGGSMDYVRMAIGVGATADGRLADQPFPSSFSPSIGAKTDGPLSVIKSFTGFDMTKIINGGPLTLEVHDNVFRNEDGITKVAMLVKSFIALGGHQLQLNAISREKLLDAQAHPEKYPDLIVRVWGWSGYFNELDLCYQNQIISRTEYMF